ncbi:MAG: hypothetical protein AB1941_00590 [Gemmatimonadota bacterium]
MQRTAPASSTAPRRTVADIVAEDRRRAVAAHGAEAATEAQLLPIRRAMAHPKVPRGPRIHASITLRAGASREKASKLMNQLGAHIEGRVAADRAPTTRVRTPRQKLPPVSDNAGTAELRELAIDAHGDAAATPNQIGRLDQMIQDGQGPEAARARAADLLDAGISYDDAGAMLDWLKKGIVPAAA